MKTIRVLTTILVLGMTILSACGPQATPPTPTEPSVTPLPGDTQTVTLDNQGGTITLSVGERFLLQLSDQYNWDVTISDLSVVSRVVNITVIRGAQGVYEAHQAGTVTLTATGNPTCLDSQPPCAMPSMLFSITIDVK